VTLGPKLLGFTKFLIAMGAPIIMELAPDNPTFYGRLAEQEIVQYPLAN
jgi:hypothetical protein